MLSNVDSSNFHYNNSIKLFEQSGDSAWLANSYTWLARNFINLEKPDLELVKAHVDKIRSLLLPGGLRDLYALQLVYIAMALNNHSIYKPAIEYLNEALPIAEKTNNLLYLGFVYFNMAFTYQSLANFPQAVVFYYKNLKISEMLNYEYGIQATLGNIGMIYKEMKDYNTALKYLNRSNEIAIKQKNKYNIACGLEEVGDVYLRQNRLKEAFDIFQNTLKISLEIKANDRIAASYGFLGDAYAKLNKPDSAFYYFKKAADLNKKMGITFLYAKNLISICSTIKDLPDNEITDLMRKVFNPNEKYKKAIEYASEALAIVKETGELDIQRDASLLLSELYEKENNTTASFKYYKQYVELNDSILNTENTKSITNLQLQYDSEKQQQQIASLQKDKALHQTEIQKQKTQRNILIAGCALVLLLIGFIANAYIAKTKANKVIEKTTAHLQNSQQQLVQQGKLAVLGKMTADVALRIKEPIGKIKTLSPEGELLVKQYEAATTDAEKNSILQQLKTYLIEINSNGVTANDVVKDVLLQTRKQTVS